MHNSALDGQTWAMDGTPRAHSNTPFDSKVPRGSQTEAYMTRNWRSWGDTLIGNRPEGPPDQEKVGMIEALGEAWSRRKPFQRNSTTNMCHKPEWLQGCDRELINLLCWAPAPKNPFYGLGTSVQDMCCWVAALMDHQIVHAS